MIKKILTGAILLGLLTAGSLIATEDQAGLFLTLVNGSNNNPIDYHPVDFTFDGETTTKNTDSDGLVKFGSKGDEGYIFVKTTWDNHTYYKAIWKQAYEQIHVTWTLIPGPHY